MRGSLGRWVVAAVIAVTAARAGAVTIDVGTATGEPGEIVAVPVSLAAEGATVIATQNRIDFTRQAFIAAKPNGQPDCTVNPAIDKEATGFRFLPLGCDPAADCSGVRVFVLSFDNLDPIADGLLYTCQVQIDPDAPDGTQPLTLAELGASAPGGVLLPADGDDGSVTIADLIDVRLRVSDASGTVGGQTVFRATLEFVEEGMAVDGVQLDIGFDPAATPVLQKLSGAPACTANAGIGRETSTFSFLPDGCEPEANCTAVRAVISTASNPTPIAPGADLFACSIGLLSEGTHALTASNAASSTPNGDPLLTEAVGGTVTVEPAPPPPPCAGDCNSDRMVAINELLIGVNINIGASALDACPGFDTDEDGQVLVSELIQAVNAALNGCPL
ncbi:MAG: hypothetical protein SF182_18920 [Deltaproteobacteria bacterium]|nr:hypothetical protein [Deltaproteobacteria bacterium]